MHVTAHGVHKEILLHLQPSKLQIQNEHEGEKEIQFLFVSPGGGCVSDTRKYVSFLWIYIQFVSNTFP